MIVFCVVVCCLPRCGALCCCLLFTLVGCSVLLFVVYPGGVFTSVEFSVMFCCRLQLYKMTLWRKEQLFVGHRSSNPLNTQSPFLSKFL